MRLEAHETNQFNALGLFHSPSMLLLGRDLQYRVVKRNENGKQTPIDKPYAYTTWF
jgi:hypothetical protein